MAVYKKKDRTARKIQKDHASIKAESTTEEVFEGLDSGANKAEEWVLKNQKIILSIMGVIVIGVIAFLAYNRFVKEPAEKNAANELAFPKAYFTKAMNQTVAKDSLFNLALNGADGKDGLIGIADRLGSTDAGNLAKYYAGISYMNLADYKKAVEYLDDFSSNDPISNSIAKGAIGDAFANLGAEYYEDALKYYEQAFQMSENSFSAPIFLNKAAIVATNLGKFDKAEKYYSKIKTEYPKSDQATDIDGKINLSKYSVK